MLSRLRENKYITVTIEVIKKSQEKQIQFLAASIAYYSFAALIPLLMILFLVLSNIFGEQLAIEIIDITQNFLTPASEEIIKTTITDPSGELTFLIIASAFTVWTTFRLFRSLDVAIALIYDTNINPPLTKQITTVIILFFTLILAGAGLVVTVITLTYPVIQLEGIISSIILFNLLFGFFFLAYFFIPNVEHEIQEVIPGALIATILWTLLNITYGIYTSQAIQYEVYGVLGGFILLLLWFYLTGIIITIGAVINGVLYKQKQETK